MDVAWFATCECGYSASGGLSPEYSSTSSMNAVCCGCGDDLICGGPGNDPLRGDAGNDRVLGDAGSDTLRGGADDDALDGGDGTPDSCDGETGTDTAGPGCESIRGVP